MPDRKDKQAYIGIDIGGTKTLYALFDDDFEVLAEEKLRTTPDKGGKRAFTAAMAKTVKKLLAEARRRKRRVRCVGVGCAGDIDVRRGVVRRSPNLPFLDGYPMRERLEKVTGGDVLVCNDVQAGLYGEFRRGAARKGTDIIGVWMGTGLGGALIIDGRLHRGASGQAGNIGNYLMHPADDSARKEVLDNVGSRSAIVGVAASLAAKHGAPKLRKLAGTDVNDIGSGDLAEAIEKGDKHVEKLVRSRARIVGAALSNLVDFINPDMVVLGGGLVEAMPGLLRREVTKGIEANCTPAARKALKVVSAKLGRHAGTVGAACLAVDVLAADSPIDLDAG